MTKSTLDLPPARPAADPTSVLNSIWALFAASVVRQAFSKRLLVLAFLYLLPIALTIVMRYTEAGFRGPTEGYEPTFCEWVMIYGLIPLALVPLTALVCSSGLIQDEIEEQTITYLLIRPLPRWSIFVAKLLATMVVTIALTATFTAITFVVIGWGHADFWKSGGLMRMFKTIALFALSLAAYDTLFGFFSLLMKRALIVGIVYIVLLEGAMAFIDFVIRKLTIMYYFRVLCERWMHLSDLWPTHMGEKQTFNIDMDKAPEISACLMVLGGAILTLGLISGMLMESREFRVKTPEGS